jgi:hypothetical protein
MAVIVVPLLAWLADISTPLLTWLVEIFLGPNAYKIAKSHLGPFCLLWEVWYLLVLVRMPMVMLIMKRFCVCHTHCL